MSHSEIKSLINANKQYALSFGGKVDLHLPPARQLAILTCVDARIDPAKLLGLQEGDAHIIRNAGGRASEDAIRSLIISHKFLGTKEWLVIHHTDCGMQTFTDDVVRALLRKSLKTAKVDQQGWHNVEESGGSYAANYLAFLPIANLEESVVEDVSRIKEHPLVAPDIPIYGYVYQVDTGLLVEVTEATRIGVQ